MDKPDLWWKIANTIGADGGKVRDPKMVYRHLGRRLLSGTVFGLVDGGVCPIGAIDWLKDEITAAIMLEQP